MPYRNTETGAFGLSDTHVRAALAGYSLPDDLASADLSEFGFQHYAAAPQPETTWDTRAEEVAPIDGVQQWTLVPNGLTEEDVRRAATPVEVWSYQAQIIMKLTTLGSLGLDGAAVGLTEEATVWEAVLAAVAALEPQPRLVAETQLASAPGFRRDSLLVAQLGPVLGLTDEMIDNMFIAAKAIP